jgi:hypothetical protein
MATDIELYRDSAAGSNTQCANPNATIRSVLTETVNVVLTDGGTAATATAEHTVHVCEYRCRLPTGLANEQVPPPPTGTVTLLPKLVTGVAVAADATNFDTFTINRRRAGGSAVPVAQYISNVAGGSTTLWVPKDLAIIGDYQFEVGDILTVSVAKAASGTAHSSATVPTRLTIPLEKN